MSLPSILFYLLGAVIAVSTGLAITRRQPVHAVVYLVVSFFATAILFALLGAPLPAVLQIIIPAGAVMVLFLFIIMLIGREEQNLPDTRPALWALPCLLGLVTLACGAALVFDTPLAPVPLAMAKASARELATYVYANYWPAVEAVSVLFFVALAGAMFLVRDFKPRASGQEGPK